LDQKHRFSIFGLFDWIRSTAFLFLVFLIGSEAPLFHFAKNIKMKNIGVLVIILLRHP